MKIPFVQLKRRDFSVESFSQTDFSAMASIHREDFTRAWTEDEFEGLLAQETVFAFVVREVGRGRENPVGFILARLVAGEGEILTVAVLRSHRRLGLGWQLMDAVLRELYARRADALFLEVDESNAAALALYRRFGFIQVGRRANYYASAGGPATSALVMRRDLR